MTMSVACHQLESIIIYIMTDYISTRFIIIVFCFKFIVIIAFTLKNACFNTFISRRIVFGDHKSPRLSYTLLLTLLTIQLSQITCSPRYGEVMPGGSPTKTPPVPTSKEPFRLAPLWSLDPVWQLDPAELLFKPSYRGVKPPGTYLSRYSICR